jgi:hypothetical protein
MSDVVERVALAIWQARENDFPPHVRRTKPDEIDWASGQWPSMLMQARAAIEAMNEPTSEMLRCGDVYVNGYEDMRSVGECWRAMLAAALSDSENREKVAG